MEHNEGVVVDEEDDYYFDDPRRTAGELIWRLRSSFSESDFAKVVSILTARENNLKKEIGSWKRANQPLKNLELGKRKADSEVKKWRTKYCLVESRISKLEAEAEELKSENAAGETEILDMDEIKDSLYSFRPVKVITNVCHYDQATEITCTEESPTHKPLHYTGLAFCSTNDSVLNQKKAKCKLSREVAKEP